MIGYGSVGRCTMPLIERHFDMPMSRDHGGRCGHDHSADAARFIDQGVNYVVESAGREAISPRRSPKYARQGRSHPQSVGRGLLAGASSTWCQKNGVLYLDTCIEPWAGYYDNTDIPEEQRTNYFLRHSRAGAAQEVPEERPLGAADPRRQSGPRHPFHQAGGARHREVCAA